MPKFHFDKNTILIGVAVIAIIITGVVIFVGPSSSFSFSNFSLFGASDKQIAQKAIDYVNKNGLTQSPATLDGNVTEASGLIKFKIKIGTNSFDSYVTKDGTLLFPQALNIATKPTTAQPTAAANQPSAQANASVKKADKPMLEAFVVSSCPYGLQMQRALADAVKSIPSLAQYIKVRYIGNVNSNGKTIDSMHGPEEGVENLNQICIREEQASKYWNYVSCYMKKTAGTMANGMPLGDSKACQASTGIDTSKLNACVSDPKRGLVYAQEDFDLATKYSVQGSPTLILNGVTVDETSFGGRSSDGVKSVVCAGFNSKAGFCSQKLNTTEASVSFNATYASASGSAPSAACAPAAQ